MSGYKYVNVVLRNFHVLDCGDSEGLRYQVWADATDPEDTLRCASAFIASASTYENAQMVVDALTQVAKSGHGAIEQACCTAFRKTHTEHSLSCPTLR